MHHSDAFTLFFYLLIQSKLSRELSASFPEFSLRNFAFYDQKTNLMVLDFSVLPVEKDDKINFVAAVGCEINHSKFGIIDISYQPLTIINGVQYFFLRTQTCNLDSLRIIYPLCEFIYISQRSLPQFQQNLSHIFDISETWEIKNSLYIVSRNLYENQSQVKTSAESKQLNSFSGLNFFKQDQFRKTNRASNCNSALQKYFTEVFNVNQNFLDLSDLSSLRQRLQKSYNPENSRWFIQQGLKQSCDRLFAGQKHCVLKQFYSINNTKILEDLKQKVIQNYKMYSFEVVRNGNKKKEISQEAHWSGKDANEIYAEKMKQRQKQKQKLRKIKKNILNPFYEAEQTWLGKTDIFQQKMSQIKQAVEQKHNKLINTLSQRDEKYSLDQIDQMIKNKNNLQIFGSSQLEFSNIRFFQFMKKIQKSLSDIIKSNVGSKQWRSKDRSKVSNQDILARLDDRIKINEHKKQGVESAIRLAQKQHQYLNEQMFPNKGKRYPFEIEK